MSTAPSRRTLLGTATAVGLTLLSRPSGAKKGDKPREKPDGKPGGKPDEDIGPGEDLMREHGVLRRVLLVYGEAGRRLDGAADLDVAVIQKSAQLVRSFVENYHERQEEEFVFPRFERAHKLVELVHVLRAQHLAGRKVTEHVLGLATAAGLKDGETRRRLRAELTAFIRMYEPHAAREDTVLLPALHDVVSRSEYDALGEDFERREHQIFGGDGFERAVAEVDAIERTLGIEDLSQFTPSERGGASR
jgi:hemerythrin-like domain-containing protein